MVRNQRKKSRDKKRAAATGASRASAATGNVHLHEPVPDMSALGQLPYAVGRELDTGLAARLVAACRAACQPCQKSLAAKLRTEQRATLAALAGAVYGELAGTGGGMTFTNAAPTTRSWALLARAAKAGQDTGEALAAVEAMDDAAATDLLENTLDHWTMGTPLPAHLLAGPAEGPRPSSAGTKHSHIEPDTDLMEELLPYVPGWEADYALATRVVSVCWEGCESCRAALTPKVVADRATLAGLAGAVFLTSSAAPMPPSAGPAARAWIERASDAARTSRAEATLRAVAELSEEDAADLLEVSLDAWAVSGAAYPAVGLLRDLAAQQQRPTDPLDTFREAGIKVVTLDDLGLGDDIDPYHLAPNYGVVLMQTTTPDGQPMPMLVLYPETEDAGIEDLERRTAWEHWGLHGLPDLDPHWRLRANVADRSLSGLVHVGPDGEDDVELWRAAESVSLPTAAWDLYDRVQHVLIAGPVKDADAPGALQAAGDAGELLAVVARVSFH